jgi:hypothetical protein
MENRPPGKHALRNSVPGPLGGFRRWGVPGIRSLLPKRGAISKFGGPKTRRNGFSSNYSTRDVQTHRKIEPAGGSPGGISLAAVATGPGP